MVVPFSQMFRPRFGTESRSRPAFNSVPTTVNVSSLSAWPERHRRLMNQLKRTPELVAVTDIIITDIIGDRPHFTDANEQPLGPTRERMARNFWRNNRMKEGLSSMLLDSLTTGDGYLWKGYADKSELRSAIRAAIKEFGIEGSDLETKELEAKISGDEDFTLPRLIEPIASSTVTIEHDGYEVLGYTQSAGGHTHSFTTEEVIHHRYMLVDGDVYGFSPVQAMSAEIALLSLIKSSMVSYFRNGGSPARMYVLPEDVAQSPNHKHLLEQIRAYRSVTEWHGNLVVTGNIQVQDLQRSPKDMDFKELALYVTSMVAFSFGIPVSRIPFLIGKSATGGDSGGLSESGYWSRISKLQDTIEDLLNWQIFEDANLHICFDRHYKQNEVRESQTASMNVQTLINQQQALRAVGKELKPEAIMKIMGFSQEDVQEYEAVAPLQVAGKNQNLLGNGQVMREPDAQKRAGTKRNVATQKGSGEALQNP